MLNQSMEWRIFTGDNKEIGTVSLRQHMQHHVGNIGWFLDIAIGLTELLDRLHRRNLLLWDLNPDRILVDPDFRQISIAGFPVEQSGSSKNVDFPCREESRAYMSPEQFGRLNMKIDHRSDLYGLGVLLYELLTGCWPVEPDDTAGWSHAIITQVPKTPASITPDIPSAISDVIMKLLEKPVEKRYQSAQGLLWDLKECRHRLLDTGTIDYFSIGKFDVASSFRLPSKLYGREDATEAISAVFDRVVQGETHSILVSGEPGVGKTMLLNEVLRPVAFGTGYYAAGKFDQLEQNVPYSAFADAFRELIKQLMTESRQDLEHWKKKITKALGRNGAVIAEIIPELEWLIGPQPPVDDLPPREAENRFLMLFTHFVKLFAQKGRPLVVFIDDLQWADPASLKLFTYLVSNQDLGSVLLVGAFRENELSLEVLKETAEVLHISLKPWRLGPVRQFIAETFPTDPAEAVQLSEMLYRKTAGNPFFLSQLLKLIHSEGLVYFDTREARWKWQTEAIKDRQPADDVLALFLSKLKNLPEETREVIKWAACISNKFSLDTLSAVCGKSMEETACLLKPAVSDGLILDLPSQFEFLHDRVQQAVYSLLSDDEKKQKHIAIGRLLLGKVVGDNPGDKVLSIMDHFNRSLDLIDDPQERIRLAGYNLLAGRKAKAAAAYASALRYFRCGKKLLPDQAWVRHYEVSYDLHLELAQGEYLAANLETAEQLFDLVIEKARTELERAGVYGLKIILYAGIGEYSRAVDTGIRALEKLGFKLPLHPTKVDYAKELFLYKWNMRNRTAEELVNLPEMEDPRQRRIAELLSRLSSVTMTSHPDLFSFIILTTGNYVVKHGNAEISSVGYFGYSITAGSILGDYQAGERYCQVAVKLVEKYDKSASKCIIYFVTGALVAHWTRPAAEGVEYLQKALISGEEAGDVLIMGYAHCLLLEMQYLTGVSLRDFEKEVQRKYEIALRLKHDNLMANAAIYGQLVSLLKDREETGESGAIDVARFKEDGVWEMAQRDGAALATFHIWEMQLNYLAGDYEKALVAARQVEPLSGSILGFMISAEFLFYYTLVITAYYYRLPGQEQKRYRRILNKNYRRMKKWAHSCQENFAHKYLLIAAEKARLENKLDEAMTLYDQAVDSAGANGYRQNEALANELAAKFYLSRGLRKVAGTYMKEACLGYCAWGALAKVRQLLTSYPDLLEGICLPTEESRGPEEASRPNVVVANSSEAGADGGLLHLIGEAAAAVANETDIQKLFATFLDDAVQVLGADKGYLILEEGDELYIQMAKDRSRKAVATGAVPLEECPMIPKTVIRYVARTLEAVVLNRVEAQGIFAADPYMAESNPGSVACLPLLFQGIPFGVVYFENSLIPGVFAEDSLEAVKLLASQVAYLKQIQSYLIHRPEQLQEEGNSQLVEALSERELDVLGLIAAGLSNKEIAERLEMTVNTAKTHIKNIYGKLQVHRRVQAVEKAKQLKII